MLSVPTLWTVFVVNFLALGLIWAYVMRSYPSFEAARFWTGSAFAAAGGAALAMLRVGCGFADAAVGRRHRADFRRLPCRDGHPGGFTTGRSRGAAPRLITGLSFAGLTFFIVGYDSTPMRILVYSLGQSVPLMLTLKLLLSRQDGRINPGARLAGIVSALIIAHLCDSCRRQPAAHRRRHLVSSISTPAVGAWCWC